MRDGTPPPSPRGKGLLSRHREQSAGAGGPARSRGQGRFSPPPSPPAPTRRQPPPRRYPPPAEESRRYRTYQQPQPPPPLGSTRMPVPNLMPGSVPGGTIVRGMPAPGASVSQWEAAPRHHAFSIFHDGNAGHLWRGEVVSLVGEGIFAVGAIIWLALLLGTPAAIALAAMALGMPYLLAGPLAVRLQNSRDPGRRLRWIGQLRALLALGLVPMHFRTIVPIVFLLLFGVALCGRLRAGARVAAMRVCLAPGEVERVSDDLQVGAALATVFGPLLAVVLFIGLGERILLVSIGACVVFFISANSDGFLDPLPRSRRAFLLARPEAADFAAGGAQDDDQEEGAEDEEADDPERLREERLPAWYQQGPQRASQWVREVRDGLALADASSASRVALYALGLLALVGGGLTVLEVFYLTDTLQQPAFYYGVLVAAEAGGMAFGQALIGAAGKRTARPLLVLGLVGVGVALAALALLPRLPLIFASSFGLGVAGAAVVTSARELLGMGATGRERLAIASGEEFLISLCGVVGAPLFALFYAGGTLAHPLARFTRFFPGWPLGELLLGTAVGMLGAALLAAVLLAFKPRPAAARSRGEAGARGRGRLPALNDGEDDGWNDGRSGLWQSAESPSAEWDRADYDPEYDSQYGDTFGDSRESRSMTGYGPATGEYEDYGDTGYRPRW